VLQTLCSSIRSRRARSTTSRSPTGRSS
jgi:hypothetical protein